MLRRDQEVESRALQTRVMVWVTLASVSAVRTICWDKR